tara:strand:+ start:116 stop:277 length:162 start_codon:yes stop_codon:yes gene_type:complete
MFIFSSLDRTSEEEIEIRGILNGKSLCITVNTEGLKTEYENAEVIELQWIGLE